MLRIILIVLFVFPLSFLSLKAQTTSTSSDTLLIVKDIQLTGNKVTIDRILFREITFRAGDTLSIKEFRKHLTLSQENLMNTSLFNIVTLNESFDMGTGIPHYTVEVEVLERWYIWPLPIFELAERNFSTWWQTKDFSLINYGLFLNWENFRGRKEHLKVLLQFGFDEKLGFSYAVPYINKKQTIGMSFGFNQTKNHAVSYVTQDNQVQRIKLPEEYTQIAYHAFATVSHRPNYHQTQYVEASYNDRTFADTVFKLNPFFYEGDSQRAKYMKLSYYFKNDHRDYKTYPLKGYYLDVLIEKMGFGFFEGSNINLFVAKVDVRKYWKLHEKWYFASGLTARLGNKDTHPYFISTGIGYGRDYVRGYEYYVVDGQDFGLLKTDLKFAIVPQRVSTIKFIPTDKFNKIPWAVYLSLFGDAAFVPGNGYNGNTLQDKMLIGYGLGLNLVTYYDVVFRMEYSFNRMGESGFFIHFMASI